MGLFFVRKITRWGGFGLCCQKMAVERSCQHYLMSTEQMRFANHICIKSKSCSLWWQNSSVLPLQQTLSKELLI